MATLQVRVDDKPKDAADELFASPGLETPTAVRMFLSASIDSDGLPFQVRRRTPKADLMEAIEDSRMRRNLYGPFDAAEDAATSMLED